MELSKFWQTIKTDLSRQMAYKLNFLLMILGPSIVFFFIKYNLWSSIYEFSEKSIIQGYDLKQMITYQSWTLVIALLGQSYNGMKLAVDIRYGRISTYLIYPFDFWQYHLAGFVSFQLVQLFVANLTLLAIMSMGLVQEIAWTFYFQGMIFTLLVSLFWFALQFILGIFAFWLDQTWVLRVLFWNVALFLSGAILPLEIFPLWLQKALTFTPFPYLTYTPAQMFMGRYEGVFLQDCAQLLLWTGLMAAGAAFSWRRGLRQYTAAGM